MRKTGFKPEELIMVGDTPYDIQADFLRWYDADVFGE
ncbi:MAG: hypothetical protein ABIR58_01450 [Gemmatimonadaceae bacterium]